MTPKRPTAAIDQAEEAEEAEHQHVQATLGGLRGHEVVQTGDLPQRLLRQHLCDDGPERRQRVVRIAGGAQEDEAVTIGNSAPSAGTPRDAG